MQTVGWVQGDVGHFYEDLAGSGGGDGNGVERRGAEEARHEDLHCCGCHSFAEIVVVLLRLGW